MNVPSWKLATLMILRMFSQGRVVSELSMLHDSSSLSYSWERLGVMILGALCLYLLTFMTFDFWLLWVLEKGENSCECGDASTLLSCSLWKLNAT